MFFLIVWGSYSEYVIDINMILDTFFTKFVYFKSSLQDYIETTLEVVLSNTSIRVFHSFHKNNMFLVSNFLQF